MTLPIVIGVDGSAPGRAAIRWGVDRAKRDSDEVLLFFVCDMTPFADTPSLIDEALDVGKGLLATEAEYAKSLGSDVPIKTKIVLGVPAHEFEKVSAQAKLIVVGTHKGVLFQNAVFGTRGIRIAAISHAPVAVVPDVKLEGRSGVLVGVDGSEANKAAVSYAANEAVRRGETLTLAAIWMMPMMSGLEYMWSAEIAEATKQVALDALETAATFVKADHPDIQVEQYIAEGVVVNKLVERAKTASVLIVGNRGRKGLSRLLLGSVSHGVLNNITSPVIVARVDDPAHEKGSEAAEAGAVPEVAAEPKA